MKKLTGILLAVCMTASLLIGCGQKADNQSTQTTESQTATVQTESEVGASEEVSGAQHCMLLAGKNGVWLLADRDNGTVFTTDVPSDLTDESGKKISADTLKVCDYVDVYGDGIMLESYPGQYPGVNKMVVTGEGTTDELKKYQDVIDMVFAEPDTSEAPAAGVVYASSLGQTMGQMTGPMNYTWAAPSGSSEDDTATACGAAVMQTENLEKMAVDEGKTDFTISCDLVPNKATVRRWSIDQYPATEDADVDGTAEDVTVDKDDTDNFVIKDVEPGYVYEVTLTWEYGKAQYGFVTAEIK